MTKRLLILSELYYPDEGATGYVVTRLAEGLARDFPVLVLTGYPLYTARHLKISRRAQHNGVNIRRCPGTTFSPQGLLPRLVNQVTLSSSIFIAALHSVAPHDTVLVLTNPPILPLLAAVVCRLRGARGVLLIHDLYPDVLVATGLLHPKSLFVRVMARLNRWTYRQYARIVVLGRDMQSRVAQALDQTGGRVVYIPNWADVETIQPQPRDQNPLLRQLGLAQKFVVQYSGTIGRTHGLSDLLDAAKQLSNLNNIQFLFIGSGARRRWLEQAIQDGHATNIILLPVQPRSGLETSLNGCDVAIISLVRGMAGISVPSRLYNIMAAGKPIIAVADPESELAWVVLEERIGWVVPPGQPERLAETILEVRANPDCLAEMGLRARASAESQYSFDRMMAAYHSLFDELR